MLYIAADGAWRFERAGELAGLGNYATAERLLEGASSKTRAVVSIGPAGEMRMAAASIAVNDPEGRPDAARRTRRPRRADGRQGTEGDRDRRRRREKRRRRRPGGVPRGDAGVLGIVLDDPRTQNLSHYGTAGVIKFVNRDNVHSLPVKNHRIGTMTTADLLSGQHIAALGEERGGKMLPCMAGCIIKCAILFNDADGAQTTTALDSRRSPSSAATSRSMTSTPSREMDRACDDIGLDTIEMGNAFGVAMQAGVLPWGDWPAVLRLFDEVRAGTPLGRVLGGGTVMSRARTASTACRL